jgi:hypothetical protein
MPLHVAVVTIVRYIPKIKVPFTTCVMEVYDPYRRRVVYILRNIHHTFSIFAYKMPLHVAVAQEDYCECCWAQNSLQTNV